MNKNADNQAPLQPTSFEPYAPKPNEEYMSADQKNHFRTILTDWKRELMLEVDQTVEHLKGDGDHYADEVDRASLEEAFTLELRTRDRERKLLKKIEKSIESISQDEYGYCDDCGADIGIKRLEARPTATKCIDCKTYQEIREKQTGV